jgi:sirohydrochlorin ferrochelatase
MGVNDTVTGLLIAHGSPDPRHAVALERLATLVGAERGGNTVRCDIAYLEHNEPTLAQWLETAAERGGYGVRAIGLLLASGYHANVDIPRALDSASGRLDITNLGTLGAGDWVIPVLERAIADVGGGTASSVVLVSAGSSQAQARSDLRRTCELLASQRHGPVLPAAVTGPDPRPEQVVAALTAQTSDVVVVPLMLAPGSLADQATAAATTIGARVTPTITTEHETPPELVAHLQTILGTPES